MPTEAQHLEQRVAALQSDLNARDQALDDAATENNERELSRRSWFDEAQRLENENSAIRLQVGGMQMEIDELRSEVKRLDLMVAQADYNYDMDRAQFRRQMAERDALPADWEDQLLTEMDRRFGLSKRDDLHMVNDDTQVGVEFALEWIKARVTASAEPSAPCTTPGDQQCPGDGVNKCKACPSAPVERDERAEFESAYAEEFSKVRGCTFSAHDVASMRDTDGRYGDRAYLNGQWAGWQARAALERKPSAPVDTVTWEDAEKVAADPEVHDALQMFSEDPAGDAGTSVVRAVLEALERKATKGSQKSKPHNPRRILSDHHCPECGQPDCNGQCFGDDMMGDS
ncbi:hypothetical protein H7A76_31890 [Pseudomonas sp. MSSRFD41]|uniref:hypothetical protein n=1 Tax=Pseudomonas sp. MSSRFD41 TaxID=1310370 RepID=UPI001639AD65|nr:hypothetical protein [Pseudomonas sp. MSSRFD41]MBC2660054.1 hypothetical protein [Pseudomonas sp. MSSRFD41]